LYLVWSSSFNPAPSDYTSVPALLVVMPITSYVLVDMTMYVIVR
jgi:hypothetical protein